MKKAFEKVEISRMVRSFWTMNEEMEPRDKVSFIREIDATAMDRARELILKKDGEKPSYTALVARATARVAQEYPQANRRIFSFLGFKRLIQFKSADIAVAVERNVPNAEAVVMVDVLRYTLAKSLTELNRDLQNLAQADVDNNKQWRTFSTILNRLPVCLSKRLISHPTISPKAWVKYRGAAFFVNSPARFGGIDFLVGDFLWPFTVSFGFVTERPAVANGELCVRRTMPLILVFDRRILAGAPAARLFAELVRLLENADTTLL